MFNRVKDIKKEIKDSLKSIEDELKTIEDSIQSATRKISELEKISADENKDKIAKLKEDVTRLAADKKKLDTARIKLSEKHDEIDKKIDDKKVEYNKNVEILNNAKRKLKLYENKKCPTCESPLDVDFHIHVKRQNEELATSVSESILKIESDIKDLKSQFNDNRQKQSTVVERISDLNSSINIIKNELLNLSKSMDSNIQFSHLSSLINEFKLKHEEIGRASCRERVLRLV